MHRKFIPALCICVLLVIPALASAQPTYQIIDLGRIGYSSVARTISDEGYIGGQSGGYAAVWNTPSPLGVLESGCVTYISGGTGGDPEYWSANGYYGSETTSTSMHTWDPSGCIGGIPQGYTSAAWLDGSEAGSVGYAVDSNGRKYASLDYNILNLMGTNSSCAYGINDTGTVVGDRGTGAFRWTQQGGAVDLTRNIQFPGDNSKAVSARSINNNGEIAGFASLAGSINEKHAGYWDSSLNFHEIGSLFGYQDSYALKINDNRQIVGYCTDSTMNSRAFLWQDGEMIDLGTLVSGGQSTAYGINSEGWIVGSATAADGLEHAVLWKVVPEPSSLAALACGSTAFFFRLRLFKRGSKRTHASHRTLY